MPALTNPKQRYYVYRLVDPRDHEPFYIGKGQRGRLYEHLREAKGGKHSRKCQRIRDIQAVGLEPKCQIIQRFAKESDAFSAEAALIEQIGLRRLTNVIPGGSGGWTRPQTRKPWTIKEFAKISLYIRRILISTDGTMDVIGNMEAAEMLRNLVGEVIGDLGSSAFLQSLEDARIEALRHLGPLCVAEMARRQALAA